MNKSNLDKEITNALKSNKKRMVLHLNKIHGSLAEQLVAGDYIAKGFIVKRKPLGQDFIVYETDDLLRPTGKQLFVEVKTGNAKLSKKQKTNQEKLKGNKKKSFVLKKLQV